MPYTGEAKDPGGLMDSQDFLAALAPALTDADARERFLADPRGILAAAGFDLPEWVNVTAREGNAPELTLTLAAPAESGAELSEEDLAIVSGGRARFQFPS